LGSELQNLRIKDYGKILELLVKLVSADSQPPPVKVEITNTNAGLSSENIEALFEMLNKDNG